MLPKRRSRECSRFARGQDRGLSSYRIDPRASRPIQPHAAPLLRRAPPRPDPLVVCPDFWFDRLFVLVKGRPQQFFTVRWRARGAVGFQGDRNVGTLFCSASPRLAVRPAPCRPDSHVMCPSFGLDRCPLVFPSAQSHISSCCLTRSDPPVSCPGSRIEI